MAHFKDIVTSTGKLRFNALTEMAASDPVGTADLIQEMYAALWGMAHQIAGERSGAQADAKLYVDGYTAGGWDEFGYESPGTSYSTKPID